MVLQDLKTILWFVKKVSRSIATTISFGIWRITHLSGTLLPQKVKKILKHAFKQDMQQAEQ
ncbi:hypothetical protein GCK32_011417 [Trichostrongylus colubriformis]|uniref:Uncharacterized protein n=1 Tax=Trichostrongylus colubriformis TaxID=6319 RepID=A0AAN8FUU9_TRICO